MTWIRDQDDSTSNDMIESTPPRQEDGKSLTTMPRVPEAILKELGKRGGSKSELLWPGSRIYGNPRVQRLSVPDPSSLNIYWWNEWGESWTNARLDDSGQWHEVWVFAFWSHWEQIACKPVARHFLMKADWGSLKNSIQQTGHLVVKCVQKVSPHRLTWKNT
jgi:hypothetical protein